MNCAKHLTIFVLAIFCLTAWAGAACPADQAYDIYVDSRRGNDANPGTLEKPLKSLPADVPDGARIGLARGSFWRGPWDLLKKRVVIGAYGEGERPVITALKPLDKKAASRVPGYKNVYLFFVDDISTARNSYPGAYVGDGSYPISAALFRVGVAQVQQEFGGLPKESEAESLDWVDKHPGWFYYTFEDGRHRYYINSGQVPSRDKRLYEYKSSAVVLRTGDGSEISGLRLLGTSGRSGVVGQNGNTRRVWKDVVYQDGGLHTMLAGTGKAWIDCTAIGTPNGPASFFHLNGPSKGSPGALYVRTKVLGPGLLEGSPSRAGGGCAYYDHTSQKPCIVMLDAEAQGTGKFFDYGNRCVDEGGSLVISGARYNDKAGTGARLGLPPDKPYGSFGTAVGAKRGLFIEDVLAYTGSVNAIDVGAEEDEYIVRNSTFVYRQDGRAGSLFSIAPTVKARFENCTFIIDTYGENLSQPNLLTGPVKWGSVSSFGPVQGELNFEKCLFVLEKPNVNYYMHFPYATDSFNITYNGCLASEGFVNLPKSGMVVSRDIFAAPRSWRNGDFRLSETSPARPMDAGARPDRPKVFRARAEAMVRDILGYLP